MSVGLACESGLRQRTLSCSTNKRVGISTHEARRTQQGESSGKPILVRCTCGSKFRVKSTSRNRQVACPCCHQPVTVRLFTLSYAFEEGTRQVRNNGRQSNLGEQNTKQLPAVVRRKKAKPAIRPNVALTVITVRALYAVGSIGYGVAAIFVSLTILNAVH
ncbi:hypothetical protein V22_10990 [Calycomorphotria hydatis]|uniref:Uncharacterized protein n=1 Tax=Calycomorphotria hydatis TaxID=2528027 RepID=A0A517T673_9PLAN|nr:hypothetical protein V22_10990 [Calycomorphotria hydatis]